MHKVYASLKGISFIHSYAYSHCNCFSPYFMGDGFGSYCDAGKHSGMAVFDNVKDHKIKDLNKTNVYYGYGCGISKGSIDIFSISRGDYILNIHFDEFLLYEE